MSIWYGYMSHILDILNCVCKSALFSTSNFSQLQQLHPIAKTKVLPENYNQSQHRDNGGAFFSDWMANIVVTCYKDMVLLKGNRKPKLLPVTTKVSKRNPTTARTQHIKRRLDNTIVLCNKWKNPNPLGLELTYKTTKTPLPQQDNNNPRKSEDKDL
ncbi:hypothetical protein QVD17_39530 [Tagetes erecta]|uniref:Uncharacterized protein n=1 Tax=Tagetes erecta TaxID=13708 RepID=A0AAD8JQ87_TARER|nr:hypothetical protein QVD17_39530 [Tagetes erecta]